MVSNIEVILFDLGGVLIELSGMQTFLGWSGEGMTPEKVWEKWLSSPTVRDFETGRIDHNVFADLIIEEMSLSVGSEHFLDEFISWPSGLFPGARDLLNRIPAEYILAVLSNTNALHWPRMMDEIGHDEVFDHFFASHIIGKLKPDLEVFEHVLTELNCNPDSILFIDDNRLNVEAASRAGIVAEESRGIEQAMQVLIQYGVIEKS